LNVQSLLLMIVTQRIVRGVDMMKEEPIVLAPGVACAHLGVTHRTLRRWIEKGLIAVHWTAGGQVRVPVSEVERIKTGNYTGRAPKERSPALSAEVERRLTGRETAEARERGREIARTQREYRRIEQSGASPEQQKQEKVRVRAEQRLRLANWRS
jgi:excisionase family DNA binding protein